MDGRRDDAFLALVSIALVLTPGGCTNEGKEPGLRVWGRTGMDTRRCGRVRVDVAWNDEGRPRAFQTVSRARWGGLGPGSARPGFSPGFSHVVVERCRYRNIVRRRKRMPRKGRSYIQNRSPGLPGSARAFKSSGRALTAGFKTAWARLGPASGGPARLGSGSKARPGTTLDEGLGLAGSRDVVFTGTRNL
ncbi:hypothetical protein CERSUDRAFT_76911 [Gelatoporia subvermispora B]|uniref:Secreted protein n=1 Tax=Ceriporiopsis subvermispora (strain B) TaxID=914234 RepID=M2R4V1_CERS8|nr:hypothetical protein CERSUDRAFT_76911 [Gelatoporia subvermispora B]